MRKGFTLVELSIVLVIIGLLIGGILVAQSMMSAAKVSAVTAQIQQFDAGVANFKTKYNALPGDAKSFGGNGVGYVGSYPFWGNDAREFAGGIGNFWNNWDSQQYPGTCPWYPPGCQALISGANKNVPEAKFGKKGSFFMASGLSTNGSSVDTTNIKHYYAILDSSQAQSIAGGNYNIYQTNSANSAVKAAELLALDTKIDDGNGNSGNILSGSLLNNGGGTSSAIAASQNSQICSNIATGAYLAAATGYTCTPLIRIGSQTGDPQ